MSVSEGKANENRITTLALCGNIKVLNISTTDNNIASVDEECCLNSVIVREQHGMAVDIYIWLLTYKK